MLSRPGRCDEKAQNIFTVVTSVNFPVRHEAEVIFSDEKVAAV